MAMAPRAEARVKRVAVNIVNVIWLVSLEVKCGKDEFDES
jgi:hypothetical protein